MVKNSEQREIYMNFVVSSIKNWDEMRKITFDDTNSAKWKGNWMMLKIYSSVKDSRIVCYNSENVSKEFTLHYIALQCVFV